MPVGQGAVGLDRCDDADREARLTAAFGESDEVRTKSQEQFSANPQRLVWLMTLVVVAKSTRALLKTEGERKDLETRVRRLYDIL